MNIHIESTYPLWLVLPLVALAIFISWLLYFRKEGTPDLPGWLKYILGFTRALAIFLTGLLAISPWIRTQTSESEKPLFIVAMDNSRSMQSLKDSASSEAGLHQLVSEVVKTLSGRFEVRQILFGEHSREGNVWDYSDPVTQADELTAYLKDAHANTGLGGALIITDGVVTRGPGFLESARNLRFPLYFAGTGDTLKKRDVSISEVVANDQVRKNSLFPVRVYYSSQGDMNGGAQILITRGSRTLGTKRINDIGKGEPFADFEIESPESGTMELKAVILPDKPDQNTDNNSRSFVVKVIGEEIHAVAVYGSAHPDIGALARALAPTPQIGLETFQAEKISALPDKCDLLILHNLPSKKYPITNLLEEARKRSVPLLIISGNQTNPTGLNPLDGRLSISGYRRQPEEIQATVSAGFTGFILPDDIASHVASWPPLEVAFETFNGAGGREILFTQRIRNIDLPDPLIFFSRFGGGKYGLIAGEGLWRWRMYDLMEYGDHQVFDNLMVSIIEYMVADSGDKRFEVKLPEENYEYSGVRIQAILRNRSMEWVNAPEVKFDLTDTLGHISSYLMGRTGNFYELSITGFQSGNYQYKAETSLGEENFSETGTLFIRSRDREQVGPSADFSGLRRLATLTGGKFFRAGQQNELTDALKSIDNDSIKVVKKYRWYDLIDLKWILIVIVLLLTLEWFLRRWFGTR